jgi:hypothetical protein
MTDGINKRELIQQTEIVVDEVIAGRLVLKTAPQLGYIRLQIGVRESSQTEVAKSGPNSWSRTTT